MTLSKKITLGAIFGSLTLTMSCGKKDEESRSKATPSLPCIEQNGATCINSRENVITYAINGASFSKFNNFGQADGAGWSYSRPIEESIGKTVVIDQGRASEIISYDPNPSTPQGSCFVFGPSIQLKGTIKNSDSITALFDIEAKYVSEARKTISRSCGFMGMTSCRDWQHYINNQSVDLFSIDLIGEGVNVAGSKIYSNLPGNTLIRDWFTINSWRQKVGVDYQTMERQGRESVYTNKTLAISGTHSEDIQKLEARVCNLHPFIHYIKVNSISVSINW